MKYITWLGSDGEPRVSLTTDDHDVWSGQDDIAAVAGAVCQLTADWVKAHGGCPASFVENDSDEAYERGVKKWIATLEKMAAGFGHIDDDDSAVDEAFTLLAKHWRGIWT